MKSVTYQATGLRASARIASRPPLPRGRARWRRWGSQTTIAIATGIAHTPSARCSDPSVASRNGTVVAAASDPPATSAVV